MGSQPAILITGCGRGGIGHALSAQFSAHGYLVISTVLQHEDRKHLIEIGAHVFDLDLRSDTDVYTLKDSVQELTGGKLQVLVNNAGIVYTMPATDMDLGEVKKMFAVNVFGPMMMVHVFHKMLVSSKGTIVNLGSVGGIVPYVYGASYNASKAALHHYGNTLRTELKPFGVRVLNVISGEVASNILKHEGDRKLPRDSLYMPLHAEFEAHLKRIPQTTTPAELASGIFNEVHGPSVSSWFWHGAHTSFVWWCDAFLPRTFWDWLFYRWFHFKKLTATVNKPKPHRA